MTWNSKHSKPEPNAILVALFILARSLWASPESAESVNCIMERVAMNQDRALESRSAFVYQQSLLIRFKRSNRGTCREESREFTVTPSARQTRKTLTYFSGKYLKDGDVVEYTQPGYSHKGIDLDGALITSFADDFANDQESRDGINTDMFPFTTSERRKYDFVLKGKELFRNREVFHVSFKPLQRPASHQSGKGLDEDGGCWAGEILVDSNDYQPVVVTTHLAKGIPFWVQTLLGTNIAHLGFKVEYEKLDDNLWFPVEYGGEFKLKALFFYKRSMAIALHNHGFQRSTVSTVLTYSDPFSTASEAPVHDPH